MNILHHLGLRNKHKGVFENYSVKEAIHGLEKQDSDFSLVMESLLMYEQQDQDNAFLDTVEETIDNDGTIMISASLDEATKFFLNVNETINTSMNESQQKYINW
ncbi:hypothetical protein [Priestia megaterium]